MSSCKHYKDGHTTIEYEGSGDWLCEQCVIYLSEEEANDANYNCTQDVINGLRAENEKLKERNFMVENFHKISKENIELKKLLEDIHYMVDAEEYVSALASLETWAGGKTNG